MSDDAAPVEYPVNLPKTDFPMKGNLAQLEPRMLALWKEQKTYPRMVEQAQASGLEPFAFPDGPPYANGHLHAGHALNKILKDIVVKYQNLAGRPCRFIPGFDTHGLPIEQAVEKRLKDKKVDRRTLPRDELLTLCRDYALEFIGIQTAEFERLGVFAFWDQPYRTLDPGFEAQELRALASFAQKRQLYRQRRPVYFCLTDQTALAEAEVEYADHVSPSVYVAFRALEGAPSWGTALPVGGRDIPLRDAFSFLAGKRVDFVIWTTTSWTLPANEGIALHPELEYVFYQLGNRVIVVAKELLPAVLKATSSFGSAELTEKAVQVAGQSISVETLADPTRILGYATGKELEGFEYQHPFVPGKRGRTVLGDHVTLDAGTGLVHTAPAHGMEDYLVGKAYGLPIYNPVRMDGKYDDTVVPELRGQHVFKVAPLVAQLLQQHAALLNPATDTLKHSYPHCWRCRQPIILSATYQWFIPMDFQEREGQPTFREQVLTQVDQVQWIPDWGKSRIRGMLENRPDWCISRQRMWGVPIPIVHCDSPGCEEPLLDPAIAVPVMLKLADVAQTEGAAVWYRRDVTDFLPPGTRCPRCQGTKFRKETDILDVWFDSACVFSEISQRRLNRFPADLYLEGSDQHRGWFHSSMLVSVGQTGVAPYKACLTHGFVVDGEGKKMAKSVGNTVAPEKIIQQYGAEVLRLWVASSEYRDDVRLSDQILKGLSEGYRKIRNTLRYALSNLFDFDPAKDAVPESQLLPLDRWALLRLDELTARVKTAYERYEFHLVYHSVVDLCATELSSLYFDISKDRLYTFAPRGVARRSAQTAQHAIAQTLLRLLSPVMSFTCEEAWQHLPGMAGSSVFHAGFPTARLRSADGDAALLERFSQLFEVRKAVQGELEAARRAKQLGASLEGKVTLFAQGKVKALLEAHRAELAGLFIVSGVTLVDAAPEGAVQVTLPGSDSPLAIRIERAPGLKCPRCWHYSEEIGPGQPLDLKCRTQLAEAASAA